MATWIWAKSCATSHCLYLDQCWLFIKGGIHLHGSNSSRSVHEHQVHWETSKLHFKSLTRITTLILCHLIKSFKDWLPIEFIYSYPNSSTFKWVAVSWQNDRVPVQKFHWWPPGDMSHFFLLIVSYKTKSIWQSMETRASQRNSCIANFCCFNVYSFSSMAQSVRSKYLSEPFNTLRPEHNGSF